MKLLQFTAYTLLFMLCAHVNLTAKQSKDDALTPYFPESYVQKLLEQSDIPQEKWQAIIASLRTKTKEMVEESGIADVISNHNPKQINRKLKRIEKSVKKALTKNELIPEEKVPAIKEKLKNTEKKLNEMLAEKSSKISESQELLEASAELKSAEKKIRSLIKRILKEELSAL